MSQPYFGAYETFDTASKDMGGALMGADNAVGDVYTIDIELGEDGHTAWLVNQFGKRIGFFAPVFSRKLSVLAAEGLQLRAVLSYVAFSNEPAPGHYWGEAAVIAYAPAYADAFEKFIAQVSERMADGVRTKVDFKGEGVDNIIESDGAWMPKQTESMPKKSKGSAILKSRKSMTDKVVSAGRAGKTGCYIASWAFIIVIAALIVWGVYSLFFASNA